MTGLVCLALLASSGCAHGVHVAEQMSSTIRVEIRNGRSIWLQCTPPQGEGARSFLHALLADPDDWQVFAGKGRIAIQFRLLKPEVQRSALLSIFKRDYVDENGWVHFVQFAGGRQGQETLWTLCEWLTGNGLNQSKVRAANGLADISLEKGQRILFPRELLREIMRAPTPERIPKQEEQAADELEPHLAMPPADGVLRYGEDDQGKYATYRLQPGEASLYTPVVMRFTDFSENVDILKACETIQERSGIEDPTKMVQGQLIKIPMDMLSAAYLPRERPERIAYEEALREARRRRAETVSTENLGGVVVILDPGHGGGDPGAQSSKHGYRLIEDEINYDICCRIQDLLLKDTQARVFMTLRDRSQGYAPVKMSNFRHDEDEELLTTPRYGNDNPKYSANLRWYLSNAIIERELEAGIDERKIVFTSVHCDALFNESIRGAMIYLPGAEYRREEETPGGDRFYSQYAESRGAKRTFRSTAAERRRDEALSRNFAAVLLEELGRKRIKRHDKSAPIRNVIRQAGGRAYVPAVLRNNKAPIKVLVEAANMTNPTDCQRLSDPDWRQWTAEAYVNALCVYFGSARLY